MGLIAAWGLGRLLQPFTQLKSHIEALRPGVPGQRIPQDAGESREIRAIAEALNDLLERNERFIERERRFIDTASHELRTPIAVIAGATSLALEDPALPDVARGRIERAARTARDMERLVSLLLVLAKSPERLARASEPVALETLIPEIVRDHLHLAADRRLRIDIRPLAPCIVHAPPLVVRAAIGNLLRNALENSDAGVIGVGLEADATVVIDDPGHGMTPLETSRLHAQLARGGERGPGGIGMELLGRLCEHLDWRLHFESVPGRGTRSVLEIAPPATR